MIKILLFGGGEIHQIQELSVLELFIVFKFGVKSRLSDGKDRKLKK